MTTKDSNQGKLQAHQESPRLEAHEEAKQIGAYVEDAAAPAAVDDPVFVNSTKGNVSNALKWGMAIMLALAVASAIVVCIGLNHHKAIAPADMVAYTTPGGNFVLDGRSSPQFAYLKTNASDVQPVSQPDGRTATAIFSDGSSKIVAIADPTTEVVYLFELDSSQIPDNATLNEYARRIASNNDEVTIVAYTDPSGSSDHNQALSEQRAKALGDYLKAHGVDPSQVKATKGYGSTDKFGSPSLDRRAELHVN